MFHKDLRLTSCLHLQLSPPMRGAEVRKSDAPPSDGYVVWEGSGASQLPIDLLTLPGLYALITHSSRDSLITMTWTCHSVTLSTFNCVTLSTFIIFPS